MAEIEKELKMRYITFNEPATMYELDESVNLMVSKIIPSSYLAGFICNSISKNTYSIISNFDKIDTIANIELFDDTWDFSRSIAGEDKRIGLATHNVGMFRFKNNPFVGVAFHRSVAWNAGAIQGELQNIMIDLLKQRGFDVFQESNDLKLNVSGYKKKFSGFKHIAVGEYFIVLGWINLVVDTDIMDLVVKKEVVKDGKYLGIPYNTIVGGLSEVKELDVDIFFKEVAQKMSEYLRLELIEDNFSAEEIIEIKKGAEKYKDMDWIMNGRAKEDALDRNSIKEAKIAAGVYQEPIYPPPARQHPIPKEEKPDPILTPKKKEVKNNGSKIWRWY